MSKRYMDFVPAKTADKRAAVASGAPRRTKVAETASARVSTTSRPKVVMPEPTATPRTRMVRRDVSRHVITQKAVVQQRPVVQQKAVIQQRAAMQHRTVAQQRAIAQKNAAVRKVTATQSSAANFAIREDAKLGEIEDLSPKFVKMDVPKRPLGDGTGRKENDKPAQTNVKNEIAAVKSKKLIGRFRNKSAAKNAAKAAAKSEKGTTAKKETFVAPKPTFINQDKVAKRPLSKNVYQKNIVATDEKANKGPVAIITKPEKESKVGLVVAIILTIILGAVAGTIAFLLLPK